MKNQQPDNFFRERLADYHKAAPAGAWDRIETSLKKTGTKFGWGKVAASLLLLASIGYVLWLQSSEPNEQSISQTQSELESPKVKSIAPKAEPSPEEEIKTEKTATSTNAIEKKSTDKKVKAKPIESHRKNIAEVARTAPAEESFQSMETSSSETVSGQVVLPGRPTKKSSITMIITVEETDKYLDKNALAEATSKDKKSSTFKRLLKKANDLTSNQDPFGDLRVKKNEILALEFKNDKRGQNK